MRKRRDADDEVQLQVLIPLYTAYHPTSRPYDTTSITPHDRDDRALQRQFSLLTFHFLSSNEKKDSRRQHQVQRQSKRAPIPSVTTFSGAIDRSRNLRPNFPGIAPNASFRQ